MTMDGKEKGPIMVTAYSKARCQKRWVERMELLDIGGIKSGTEAPSLLPPSSNYIRH